MRPTVIFYLAQLLSEMTFHLSYSISGVSQACLEC